LGINKLKILMLFHTLIFLFAVLTHSKKIGNNEHSIAFKSPFKQIRLMTQKYNPELRRVMSCFFESLTKNGRGFALACAGFQHLAMRRVRNALNAPHEKNVDDAFKITFKELADALEQGIKIRESTVETLAKSGWNAVHESDVFSLFKRKLIGNTKKSASEYLIMGNLTDITPRNFLKAQVVKQHRENWDSTMAKVATMFIYCITITHFSQTSLPCRWSHYILDLLSCLWEMKVLSTYCIITLDGRGL
jgi:hypothetical protein